MGPHNNGPTNQDEPVSNNAGGDLHERIPGYVSRMRDDTQAASRIFSWENQMPQVCQGSCIAEPITIPCPSTTGLESLTSSKSIRR